MNTITSTTETDHCHHDNINENNSTTVHATTTINGNNTSHTSSRTLSVSTNGLNGCPQMVLSHSATSGDMTNTEQMHLDDSHLDDSHYEGEDNGKVSDGGKMRLVNSLSNSMSFVGSKSDDDAVDSDDKEISINTSDDFDLSDPKELFDGLQRQALDDGHINELTRILSNLVTHPSTASGVWHNVSRIVGKTRQPIQTKMLKNNHYGRAIAASSRHGGKTAYQDAQENAISTLLTVNASIKPGTAIETRVAMDSVLFNQNECYFGISARKGSAGDQAHYLISKAAKQLKEELEAERKKTLKLEKELEKLACEFDELKNKTCVDDERMQNQVEMQWQVQVAVNVLVGVVQVQQVKVEINLVNEKLTSQYRRMLRINMPKQFFINRMRQDRVDEALIDIKCLREQKHFLEEQKHFLKILKSVDSNLKQRLELWSFKILFFFNLIDH